MLMKCDRCVLCVNCNYVFCMACTPRFVVIRVRTVCGSYGPNTLGFEIWIAHNTPFTVWFGRYASRICNCKRCKSHYILGTTRGRLYNATKNICEVENGSDGHCEKDIKKYSAKPLHRYIFIQILSHLVSRYIWGKEPPCLFVNNFLPIMNALPEHRLSVQLIPIKIIIVTPNEGCQSSDFLTSTWHIQHWLRYLGDIPNVLW